MKHLSEDSARIIGVMSGTSLDGLDIVAVRFYKKSDIWRYSIDAARTFEYDNFWRERLGNAHNLSGKQLTCLHNEFGSYIGKIVNDFAKNNSFTPELIASHGHTIFHRPYEGLTFQAGNGIYICSETHIPVIYDFRTKDVSLGGQGAPLVPAGDRLLFSEYRYCLNLGGFANISFDDNNKRIAFDICPVNYILNYLAGKMGYPFDKNGELGKSGDIHPPLLDKLNELDFYKKHPPKSLGREWVEEVFLPGLMDTDISVKDKLRTVYEHIAQQIGKIATENREDMLVTGGGAFNKFLIDLIKNYSSAKIFIPVPELINFKEALIFAFLGLLRYRDKINCYASVTGAIKDSSTGIICFP